ncbi:MAG: 50S ribosome-binding GTPase [Desulfobacterales bacterium]|nr:MAG: 50S ribosome-binding GTPase [Desulfobacterales bacterium]
MLKLKKKPIVAIAGRPNVGKSPFFNKVTRTRDALVNEIHRFNNYIP